MIVRPPFASDRSRRPRRNAAAGLLAAATLATAGCLGAWSKPPEPVAARPTVRHVRHELRGVAVRGLLLSIEAPLAPEEDLRARIGAIYPTNLAHRMEIEAAIARANELTDQLEDLAAREVFLAADRPRQTSRVETLKTLFVWRFRDAAVEPDVYSAWERLDDALATIDRDPWLDRQRLFALEILLGANYPKATPRLMAALEQGFAPDDPSWTTICANLPALASGSDAAALWTLLGEKVDLDNRIGLGVLQRLEYDDYPSANVPHPFDDEAGRALLEEWLTSEEPDQFSRKLTVLRNARHLDREFALGLCRIGEEDVSPVVRLEALSADWKIAFASETLDAIDDLCRDERIALAARSRLQEFGHGYRTSPSDDPLFEARARVFERCGDLRYQVDPIPADVTLLAETIVPWSESSPPGEVRVFSFHLPVDPSASESAGVNVDEEGEELARTTYHDPCGYAVDFDEMTYLYSSAQVAAEECATALDVAGMAHRDWAMYDDYDGDYSDDEKTESVPAPAHAASLAEGDWRWGELRVPLPDPSCATTPETDEEANDE